MGRGSLRRQLAAVLAPSVFAFAITDAALASDSADLMNSFERLCIDSHLEYSAVSSSAATDHLPVVDQSTTSIGGKRVRTSMWLIRKEPPAALIVVDEVESGKVSFCGINDHATPLADMANELASRIRTKQLPTRGMGVNNVQLEDNSGGVHIISDPGGASASGFFLFRDAPRRP